MGREYRILQSLAGVYPKAPHQLLYTDDPSVIGAPFYVMERVHGLILRNEAPPGLTITPATMREISAALVKTLVELHAVDYTAAGLADLGKPAGYVGTPGARLDPALSERCHRPGRGHGSRGHMAGCPSAGRSAGSVHP